AASPPSRGSHRRRPHPGRPDRGLRGQRRALHRVDPRGRAGSPAVDRGPAARAAQRGCRARRSHPRLRRRALARDHPAGAAPGGAERGRL
ncbi:MAG: hypothetical protein AVDCRST_MAG69-2553, partial [uncultured Solirubrobacteraceae bacterium]